MVPTKVDLLAELESSFPSRPTSGFNEISSAYEAGTSYLLYEASDEKATIFDIPVLPSQYMRMLLAKSLGLDEKYDWRDYPGSDELRMFFKDLASLDRRNTRDTIPLRRGA